MTDKVTDKPTRLQVIEKSLFFRALAPIVFLALLALCVYSWMTYLGYQALFAFAVETIEGEGYAWEYVSYAVELDSQQQTFGYLTLFSTIFLLVVGLILNFWGAWAVSNFAANKGFNKRQYFWLSFIIGPLIPWIIATASKKTVEPHA